MLAVAHDEGYRTQVRDGEVFFCRREIPTGSNLPRTHCVNSTGLRWELQQQERQRQQMEQGGMMNCQPWAAGRRRRPSCLPRGRPWGLPAEGARG